MVAQIQTKARKENGKPSAFLRTLLRKQPMMRRVLLSLTPILVFSVYSFGWRVLSVLALVTAAGVTAEYFFEKQEGQTIGIRIGNMLSVHFDPACYRTLLDTVVELYLQWFSANRYLAVCPKRIQSQYRQGIRLHYLSRCHDQQMDRTLTGFPGGFAKWVPGSPTV